MRPILLAAVVLLALPSAARAESCGEQHESCLEDCHVDHGMEKERVKLTKCVKRCDDRFEDCQDLRQEERRSQVELAPQECKAGTDPSDVRPVKDEQPTDVRPAPPEDDPNDPKSKSKAKAKAEPREDDPPALEKKPKAEDDPPPAKKDPPKKKKDDEYPDRRGGEDDWAK